MKTHTIGWQSDDNRAVVCTRWWPFALGRGLALTRIFRKLPNGSVDLLQPILIEGTLLATEEAAAHQHHALWHQLKFNALDPRVMQLLLPSADGSSPLEDLVRARTTPN